MKIVKKIVLEIVCCVECLFNIIGPKKKRKNKKKNEIKKKKREKAKILKKETDRKENNTHTSNTFECFYFHFKLTT